MALTDLLHDEIDDAESMVAEARDIVRGRLDELQDILSQISDAGIIDARKALATAVDVASARIAGDLNDLTTRAASRGVDAGRLRVNGVGP
jgi:hypothetical protein